jgi:hypothetical protein
LLPSFSLGSALNLSSFAPLILPSTACMLVTYCSCGSTPARQDVSGHRAGSSMAQVQFRTCEVAVLLGDCCKCCRLQQCCIYAIQLCMSDNTADSS